MGPGPEKCVQRWRWNRFVWFFRAIDVRSRSQDRFLESPTLQNRVPTTSESTILTKSPFSKKHRKSSLRRPGLRPKIAKNRCRSGRRSQKVSKKVVFRASNFAPFFGTPKKKRKIPKTGARMESTGGVRRSRGARRGGKEGKPLRDRRKPNWV